ncbi:MAG TPA: ABC transporter ATP-binding protein [Steroidobacteraceae bacterium]|nr:ABC transporter ATP-binding protein [Steroidobacteraceae bacterium]
MASLTIRRLSIALGGTRIVDDVSLEVAGGEFLVLLGPSGCGKSTLLNGIAGLVEPASGSILLDGQDITHADPAARDVGMVFQSYALYPAMTVAGNLGFGLRVRGLPRTEVEARVRKTAQLLQLESLLERKPAQLSGGQRQRVAIGRALVRDARIFLLDEPLSNLDAGLRAELRRELKLLHQRLGATMIHVTHDQVEAMTLATRIAVMRGGRILQVGVPAEVYARPLNRFVAGFLGSPAINFVPGIVQDVGGALGAVANGCRVELAHYAWSDPRPAHGREVTLAIRPEHIRLAERGAFEGRVTLVEPMGNQQVAWIDWGGNLLSCLSHDAREFRADEAVRFDVDATKLSLFDNDSERRL